MNDPIDAIVEGGFLKPLEPLHLPEQTRVKISINAEKTAGSLSENSQQKKALQDLWQEVDRLPQTANNDNWSAAQHDELLYNSK